MPSPHRRLHNIQGRGSIPRDGDNDPEVVVKTVIETVAPTLDIEARAQLAQDSAIPSAIEQPDKTDAQQTYLAEATGQAPVAGTQGVAGQDDLTTEGPSTPKATGSSDSSSSSTEETTGLSTGAIAGIVFGVLGGLLVVGLIIYFAFARRKQPAQQMGRQDDEKLHGPMNGHPPADAKAPRVSLRPVTQFFPAWNPDKRSSKGAAMALSPTSANNRAPGGSAWDRPSTSQSMHPNNPFGNQAERAPSPVIEEHSMYDRSLPPTPASEMKSPFDDPTTTSAPAGMSRKTSMRNGGPKKLDLTVSGPMDPVPASPAGTEFSVNSDVGGPAPPVTNGAAAIAAAGGPSNSAVHRVQLDFKPTLEDEMGLRAGDLVRLLHEYDDGWALCIRLDRSQQGVVPRTCLSTRPVKPRAPGPRPGPPVNPNRPRGPGGPPGQRPMTPQGYGRPESPAQPRIGNGGRPASPAGRPMSPAGRPMSPAGRPMSPAGRPMSPAGRPMSPAGRPMSPAGRPMSPAGRPRSPSGLNRQVHGGPGPSRMNPRQGPYPGSSGPAPGQAY